MTFNTAFPLLREFMSIKKPNILLINPWIYDFAAYDFWIKPLGLLSISTILEKFGYATHLLDCMDRFHSLITQKSNKKISVKHKYGTGKFLRTAVEKPKCLEHVPKKFCRYGLPIELFYESLDAIPRPDAILVTSMMTYWYPGVFKVIQIMKKKFPGVPVILGGIYATLCKEHATRYSNADYIISGPGEKHVLKLLDSLTGHESDWSQFPENWKNLPAPDFHQYKTLGSIPLLTSKGCPYRCTFCASHLLSGKFEQKNPHEIFDQISYFYRKRKITNFAFFDDGLFINKKKHIIPLLKLILSAGIQSHFHTPNGVHAREIDFELAQHLYQSRFKTIRLSYETINIARQAEMKNKVSDDTLISAIENLERAGYLRKHIDVYVIMGLPNQSFQEVIDSIKFVNSLGVKVRLTSFSPIPKTTDWQRSVENYGLRADIDPLLTNNSIFPLYGTGENFQNFQQIRQLSTILNYGIEQEFPLFGKSDVTKMIWKNSKLSGR